MEVCFEWFFYCQMQLNHDGIGGIWDKSENRKNEFLLLSNAIEPRLNRQFFDDLEIEKTSFYYLLFYLVPGSMVPFGSIQKLIGGGKIG